MEQEILTTTNKMSDISISDYFTKEIFKKVSNYGFGFSSPTSILDIPCLKQDSENGETQVICQGYLDRPPHEGFNKLRTPFLPVSWNVSENEENSRQALSLSQSYFQWYERLQLLRKKESAKVMIEVRKKTYMGEEFKVSDKLKGRYSYNQKSYLQNLHKHLDEYTFGPAHLYSSSCLQIFRDDYLAFADFSNKLKLNRIRENSDTGIFSVRLDRTRELEVGDDELGKYSRVYGVVVPSSHSFTLESCYQFLALKYWEGGAVFRINEDESADSLSKTKLSDGNGCCDISLLPWLEKYLVLDTSGKLILTDFRSSQIVKLWSEIYSDECVGYRWSRVLETPSSPYVVRIGSRKSVSIFDIRTEEKRLKLATWPDAECLGALAESHFSPFQFYAATNLSTSLMDERMTSKPVAEWTHPTSKENLDIPIGCDALLTSSSLEYVSTYWSDGDVLLNVLDRHHAHCHERNARLPIGTVLSCQLKNSDPQKGEDLNYPVYRGMPVALPSVKNLLNQCSNLKEKSFKRLMVPWTGLKMALSPKSLNIFAVNAVGDVFQLEMEHVEVDLSSRDEALANFDKKEEAKKEEKNQSKPEAAHVAEPADFYSPFWLLESSKEFKFLAKNWTAKWEDEYLNRVYGSWSKLSFANYLHRRTSNPGEIMPLARQKPLSTVSNDKKKVGRPHKILPHPEVAGPAAGLPYLSSIEDPPTSFTGRRVQNIFDNVDIFDDVEVSDEENLKYLRPPSLAKRLSVDSDAGHPPVPSTLAEIPRGTQEFEPLMVSTQQSHLAEPNAVASQEAESHVNKMSPILESQDSFFGSQQSRSRDHSKQKKKKKFQVGF